MIEILQPEVRGDSRSFEIVVGGPVLTYANSFARSIEVHQSIPESFLSAIADYENGRVVDADQAMNEPPPPKSV